MSTSEEIREQQPSPVELVDEFNASHQALMDDATVLCYFPTRERLDSVAEQIIECERRLSPFRETMFFRDSDNPINTTLALSAVIDSSNEIAERVSELDPECDSAATFKPDIQPYLAYCISEDESIELSDEYKELIDETENCSSPKEVSEAVCNTYTRLLKYFELALLKADKVSAFVNQENEKYERKVEKRRQMKLFGGVALAAFAGSYMANKFSNR